MTLPIEPSLPAVGDSSAPAPASNGREPFRGRRRLRDWSRLSHGLYLPKAVERKLIDKLRAWSLVLPDTAAFTHLTAAELRGWWLPVSIRHPLFAAVREGDSPPRRKGLFVCRHPKPVPIIILDGLRVTTAAETLLAAARDLGVLDLVVMADSALRLQHLTLGELRIVAAQRRRGAPRLREIIRLLDPRSESPWESIMRVLHRVAEIPVEPQREIFDKSGRFLARADLWIVGTRRIHEYDGDIHRAVDAHTADLMRDRRLSEAGWQRFGFTSRHLIVDGANIIASADRLLGRPWDGRRLADWNDLLSNSLLRSPGRSRALARWNRAL